MNTVAQRLYTQSFRDLNDQWSCGPLDAHRNCCRGVVKDKRLRSDLGGTVWVPIGGIYTSGRERCKSNSCRPGDPWGCSMVNARHNWKRSRAAFERWVDSGAGRSVYVVRFTSAGQHGAKPAAVLNSATWGISRILAGGSWIRERKQFGLIGHIVTTSVSAELRVQGNIDWTVHKWATFAGDRVLDEDELSDLRRRAASRWDRAIDDSKVDTLTRVSDLQPVTRKDIDAVMQASSGALSPLDRSASKLPARLAVQWGSIDTAVSMADLRRNDRDRFREYALAVERKKLWTPNRLSADDSQDPGWSDILSDVRAMMPEYLDGPFETKRRLSSGKGKV